jgi:formylmethanofuran dehydrogenase subunit B
MKETISDCCSGGVEKLMCLECGEHCDAVEVTEEEWEIDKKLRWKIKEL